VIRIHLSSDDIARIRVVESADFGMELMSGGALAAHLWRPPSTQRLARWHQEMQRRQDARTLSIVTGLYISRHVPGMLGRPDRMQAAAVADHLDGLATADRLTRFNQALANGDLTAHEQLATAIADFRAAAVEPYRRRISSAVARAGARTITRAASSGIGLVLSTLHPSIRWNRSTLTLATDTEHDLELDGRTLVLRPLALAAGFILDHDIEPEAVVIGYPTPYTISAPDARIPTASPALSALLGGSRAAALATITWSPAITTGQLAEALGLSPAAASRHTTVLRDAGLIDTVRDGPAVRHRPTRLGTDLISDSGRA